MDSFNERRYDRRDEERYTSPRDERNDRRRSNARPEGRDYYAPQNRNDHGDRGYGSDESWRQNRADFSTTRNDNSYDNRGEYRNERGNDYDSRYRNERYNNEHYSGNSGNDSRYGSSPSGRRYQGNEASNYGDRNNGQTTNWEGRTDIDYNDWSNGRKSRGLGRSEGGNYSGESHRGKGPKNYSRPESRIIEDISDRLSDHYAVDASDIEIQFSSGNVILTGTVDSRYAKRQAEDAIENVSGVNNIENRLHVKSQSSSDSRYGASTNNDSNKSKSKSEKQSVDENSRNGKTTV